MLVVKSFGIRFGGRLATQTGPSAMRATATFDRDRADPVVRIAPRRARGRPDRIFVARAGQRRDPSLKIGGHLGRILDKCSLSATLSQPIEEGGKYERSRKQAAATAFVRRSRKGQYSTVSRSLV